MRVLRINSKYNVLEIKRNKMYCYYLEKQEYGDLWHLYDVNIKLKRQAILLNGLAHINFAESVNFWGEEYD